MEYTLMTAAPGGYGDQGSNHMAPIIGRRRLGHNAGLAACSFASSAQQAAREKRGEPKFSPLPFHSLDRACDGSIAIKHAGRALPSGSRRQRSLRQADGTQMLPGVAPKGRLKP